ncbi:hypothetical protein Pmani_026752 [Petrolisthes manimaculis]|uniref:Translin-associated factor X-interacting protein 1 N-terminal domain-containing protein n=1 Tax=Petrolisthes manimaculis TaxID=1843537 RepID=A0AAE1TX47_9EUCA|nr:hypothetical protein Pmani_026752 [Petrolisthes manimaculis]
MSDKRKCKNYRTRVEEGEAAGRKVAVTCEDLVKVRGRGVVGGLEKPRKTVQLEEELRDALRHTFCCTADGRNDSKEGPTNEVSEVLGRVVTARHSDRLLLLLHHAYIHVLTRLHAHATRVQLLQDMLDNDPDNPYGRLRQEELCRLRELETLNGKLTQRLEESESQVCTLREQIERLEDSLGEERRHNLCQQDEMRRQDVQVLEARMETGALRRRLKEHLGDEAGDPQVIKIAWKRCREELSAKTKVVQEMERQYREVVPRADFDRLQRRLSVLTTTHHQLTHTHTLLTQQHEAILSRHEGLVNERDQLSEENQALRRSATPRPDWNRVAEYVEGGISRWRELSSGRTSDQMVDILISELTGSQLSTSSEFIDGKGMEPGVPAYLRYEGSVRNRRLGKRDLLPIIEDIWRHKRRLDNTDPLELFVDQYFKERYHLEEVRAEWCYSLADACQRLAHEEQVGLFWGILCGQVQEQVYHHHVDTINDLYSALTHADTHAKDVLSVTEVEELLQTVFPLKSEDHIKALLGVMSRAASPKDASLIKYHHLFPQGRDVGGVRSQLAGVLAGQARDQQDTYIQEVLDELGYSLMDVSVAELSRAFTMVDPRIEQQQLESYLEWIFNTNKDQLKNTSPVPLPLLAARLQTGHIVRVGARA